MLRDWIFELYASARLLKAGILQHGVKPVRLIAHA